MEKKKKKEEKTKKNSRSRHLAILKPVKSRYCTAIALAPRTKYRASSEKQQLVDPLRVEREAIRIFPVPKMRFTSEKFELNFPAMRKRRSYPFPTYNHIRE